MFSDGNNRFILGGENAGHHIWTGGKSSGAGEGKNLLPPLTKLPILGVSRPKIEEDPPRSMAGGRETAAIDRLEAEDRGEIRCWA